jgi:hypothetical protein
MIRFGSSGFAPLTPSLTKPAPGSSSLVNLQTQDLRVSIAGGPVPNTDLGLEYIYANRKTEDGLKGRLNRLQASAKYTF